MRTRAILLVSAAVLVVAAPMAVWGLMGQDDYQGLPPSELDYAVRPPGVPAHLALPIGLVGLALAAAAGTVLVRGALRGAFDPRWWQVLAPLVATGVISAWCWRVMTAGVVGANIGAGIAVALGTPVVFTLLVCAVVRTVALLRRRDGRDGGHGGRGMRPGPVPGGALGSEG
ncbi:hypothetical protein AB0M29_29525 [Streptomyces sp. NPDC051976]|uniref:hypothetical protein n=1 Tax=Streptomyces sp. NPDC051976 TaxID=3154947 RepID=UPI003432E8D5